MTEEAAAPYAAKVYHDVLFSDRGRKARTYLSGRGITDSTIRRFRIGYAPSGWAFLARRRGGPTREALEAADLVRSKEGRAYDTFRGRIMLPYADGGEVLGFSGRILPAYEADAHRYNNSRGMPKAKLLFGWDQAQAAIAREGSVYLVEGQIDTLAMASAGRHNVVGIGRALLSRTQAERIAGLGREVVLVPDGDQAGRAAVLRNAEKLADYGAEMRVATLSSGKDAGEVLQSKGPEALYAETAEDRHVLALAPEVIAQVNAESGRAAVDPADWAARYVGRFPEAERDRLLAVAPNRASVEEKLLQQAQKRPARRKTRQARSSGRVTDKALEAVRSEVSLVEVARRYTDLQPSGDSWKGSCPAHADKDPSFYVREGRGYHCFGCGFEGGDAISLVMQMERVDFPTAVRQLAHELDPALVRQTTPTPASGMGMTQTKEAMAAAKERDYVYHHLYTALRDAFRDPPDAFHRLEVMHRAGTLHRTWERPELLGPPRSKRPLARVRHKKKVRDIVRRFEGYVEKARTAPEPVKPPKVRKPPARVIGSAGKAASRTVSTLYRGARIFFER